MSKSADYASDSDLSDEDFCPENEAAASELSEESSDDEIEEDNDETKTTKNARKSRKRTAKLKKLTTQNEDEPKRSTRTKAETIVANEKKIEKDDLESDDDEKARADALWADFLGDVKQTTDEVKETKKDIKADKSPTRKPIKTTATVTSTNSDKPHNGNTIETEKAVVEKPKQITITEIMDFAGEEVKVQKVISAESIKENKTGSSTSKTPKIGVKRPAAPSSSSSSGGGGGGLGSILNQIGKKKKISVLEKTKLDWNTFKQDEGIEEELQTFNKGKDGYLERQDFLQRTDVRQFEIERNLRQTRRNN